MEIIITMAGKGSRFSGFREELPKHMLPILGKTMFEWAVSSLKNFFSEHFIFIALDYADNKSFIREKCKALGINNFSIILIKETTSGQAETALFSEKAIADKGAPIIIYNIDTFVERDSLKPSDFKGDGCVPCFKAEGNQWSFAEFDSNMLIKNITEKVRISDYCSIGLYYFKSFERFRQAFNKYYALKNSAKERYVAPVYNDLLINGEKVYATVIDSKKVHVLGTPAEVEKFEKTFR
jgi:NDP-sugar pyrophosphorylase family protein